MMNLKQINKKSLAIYFKQLILFAVCTLFFGIGVNAQSSVENSETCKVTLPQKIEGVQKLEYIVDSKNMGSTSGVAGVEFAPQTILNFLIQVEPENYSQLRVKDVKIKSQSGETLNLMKYMYDKNGKFTKVLIPEDELIDPKQTYVTSDYMVNYNEKLYLNEISKDSFNTNISMDTNDYSINQALDISYNLANSSDPLSPIYNEKENRFEIHDVTVNTPITLTINKNQGFSQSKIAVFNGDNQINLFEDGSATIPAIKSDLNITIKNINKNRYNLSFKNSDDISFEYRKHGENLDFKAAGNETLDIIHGENYDFRCNLTNENALENKEITANGVAIKKANNMYSISNIQENTTIEIKQKEESSYGIGLPKKESGVTITNESDEEITSAKAKFGEGFKFKLKANEEYTQRINGAMVYAVPTDKLEDDDYDTQKNPEEASKYLIIPSNNAVFTIPEVKEPTSIIVKNLVKNIYNVTFPEAPAGVSYKVETSEGVKEESENVFTVVHGSKIFLTLDAAEGKCLSENALTDSDSKTLVTNEGNRYTIENITEDTSIIINSAEDKKCNVSSAVSGVILKDENGYALGKNCLTVDYNGSARFKIGFGKEYKPEKDAELSIVSGDAALTKLDDSNLYEISNIKNDVKVSVKGIEKEKVRVRFGSDGGEKLNFKTVNNEALPKEIQIGFGEDLEFEVVSPTDSNQAYNITSTNRNARIEALDNSKNRFVLRKATSNTDLFAHPVYTSYNGSTNDLEEITEYNGERYSKKSNDNTAYALEEKATENINYNTAYTLEEPNIGTDQDIIVDNSENIDNKKDQLIKNSDIKPIDTNVTRYSTAYTLEEPNIDTTFDYDIMNTASDSQPSRSANEYTYTPHEDAKSTALTYNNKLNFRVNHQDVSWNYMLSNYDIYYKPDLNNAQWRSFDNNNKMIRLYDDEVQDIRWNNDDMEIHYAFKVKFKIVPKNKSQKNITSMVMRVQPYVDSGFLFEGDRAMNLFGKVSGTAGGGTTIGYTESQWPPSSGRRIFRGEDISGFYPDEAPYMAAWGYAKMPTIKNGTTTRLTDDEQGGMEATLNISDIRCVRNGEKNTFTYDNPNDEGRKDPKQTILFHQAVIDIYEDQYLSIQPLKNIQFVTDLYNAAEISKVSFDYVDYYDTRNSCTIQESLVDKPTQNLELVDGATSKPPKMTLVNNVDNGCYKSNFDMEISIESKDGIDLDLLNKNLDDNGNYVYNVSKYITTYGQYMIPETNKFTSKYIAIVDSDGQLSNNMYLHAVETYLDTCEVEKSTEGGKSKITLHLAGSFEGWLVPSELPPDGYKQGATDYYVDYFELLYNCEAPRNVPGKITFSNPNGDIANFVQAHSNEQFPTIEDTESGATDDRYYNAQVPTAGRLQFKLKTADSHYLQFSNDNAEEELKQALIINGKPATSTYDLDVSDWNEDHSYAIYEIRNIVNREHNEPVRLNISVNTNMIQKRQFEGNFKSGKSTYLDTNDMPIVSKTFTYGDNFTFYSMPDNTATADKLISVVFTIDESNHYCSVHQLNGESQNIANGKLTARLEKTNDKLKINLENIKTNFTVTVSYGFKDLDIKFYADNSFRYKCLSPTSWADENNGMVPADESQTMETKKLTYGTSIAFVVVTSEGYSMDDIEVTASGMPIELTSGMYSLDNVTGSKEIRVRGVSISKNNVTFTQYDDVYFKTLNNEVYSEQTQVDYDGNISFKVTTSAAYSDSADDIKVWAEYASGEHKQFNYALGSTTIKNSDGSYTLKNVKEAVRIYVEGMEPNKYEVTLNPTVGIEYYNEYGTEPLKIEKVNGKTVYKQTGITHGENFSFRVVAKTGYDISNIKIYDKPDSSGKSTQILPSHDVYTINNVTENHTVTAQDTPKSKCKIEFRTLTGANFTDTSGNTIDKSIEVDYGSDYKFKVSLESAYNKSQPVVNIKGVAKPLQKAANGNYTIPNVTEDKIIEISNVTKNTYTATFVDTEGVIYRTAKNKPFTGTQPIEYEGTLNFKISLMDAYDKSKPTVLLDDKKVLGENSGVYTISNVHDDVVITVKNVVKNPEEVSISENLKVPSEINTEGDVDDVVKATQVYMSLSDEDKEQVTNIDDLKKAQEYAGRINHSEGDTEIAGVDWNIKLIVTPLTDDEEQMNAFKQKIDGRSIFSLYEIHLVDLLSGKDFEVPYGQKVSVIVPAPSFNGYKNPVVAHETSAGSMEYLDISVVDNRAQFETSSFSKFGIVAKKLENYVENPSNLKISVNNLVENEDELRSLLGEGLVSQLGNLLDNDDKEPDKQEVEPPADDSTQNEDSLIDVFGLKKVFDEAGMEDSYNWILEHELIIVSSVLLIGALLIWLLLAMARKKKQEEEEKSKNKK